MSYKVNCNCLKVTLVLSFLLLFQFSKAQYNFGILDAQIESSKEDFGKNFVALIYKDGKIVYKKEIGEEFKINSQAPIASCSKWLTAAMVMTFVDQGKISLDDYVGKYLPIFKTYGKGYITIRQCLSHQTGIDQDSRILLGRKSYSTLEEEVNELASKKEIIYNAGEYFHYGSAGINIAARVCEVVSKKQFEQLMNDRIIRPLQMKGTTFGDNYNKGPNPSGGALSTAQDYSNFLNMILNKGMFNKKRILSEASIAEMQKPQMDLNKVKYAPKLSEGFAYGLGEWIIESNEKGEATVLSSPGLFGTWPMIDKCRGYTCIFLTKTLLTEKKKDTYLNLKKTVDEIIGSGCN